MMCREMPLRHRTSRSQAASLVDALPSAIHGFLIGETRKWCFQNSLVGKACRQVDVELLHEGHDIGLTDGRQFHVELRKFRLPVSTLRLIAETSSDLKIRSRPAT